MYIPPHFAESDLNEIQQLLEQYSFATLVSQSPSGLMATHLPLKLDASGDPWKLSGHFARANPQYQSWTSGAEILVIFQGPHAYVSSRWYDHVNVPTWNYQAVHIYASFRLLDEAETITLLLGQVRQYESDAPDGLRWDTLPQKVASSVRAIQAFELTVTRLEAKSKLSQNRKDTDYHHVVEQLLRFDDTDSQATARAMQRKRPQAPKA